MTAPDLAPKGIGELLDAALTLLRCQWRTVFGAAGIALFPFALLVGTLQAFYVRGFLEQIPNLVRAPEDPSAVLPTVSALGQLSNLASLAYLLAAAFFTVAVVSALPALLYGHDVRPGQMLKGGWSRLLWFGLTVLVLYVMLVVASVVAVLSAVFTLGISLLVVVPVLLWLAARLGLAPLVSVAEDANPAVAIRRSWTLTARNAWRIVGFYIGVTLLMQAIVAAVNSPAVIRQVVDVLTNATPDNPALALTGPVAPGWKVMEGFLSGAATTLAAPVGTVAWYFMYIDLRSRRDGMDLVMRASALAEDAA